MPNFQLNGLDHVAIRVKDLELSSQWYVETLGLKKVQLDKWGAYPIFLLSGKTGVALFPLNKDEQEAPQSAIDHFAFNISNESFEKAMEQFNALGVPFQFKDHFYFHSIYLTDPDGHIVELTTLKVDEKEVY